MDAESAHRLPSPVGDPYLRTTVPVIGTKPKKRAACWWCLPAQELNARDGWFKSPRNLDWTIDSSINGKSKPSGYDSNSLITILRSSQCFTAMLVLILYVFTSSVPRFWLIILASVETVLSGTWSIFALFLRHYWSIWLVIPEILLTVAWIVLFAASSALTPEESKQATFNLSLIAMEASMVLWIQTCLLSVTPFFHKLMPWLFRVRSHDNAEPSDSTGNAQEMSIMPNTAAESVDGIAYPQPMRGWPALSRMEISDSGTAEPAEVPGLSPRALATPHGSGSGRMAAYIGPTDTIDDLPLHTARSAYASSRGLRSVSPVSVSSIRRPVSPLTARSTPSTKHGIGR